MQLTKGLKHDLKLDLRAAKKLRLPWWALLCLFIVDLSVVWLFDYFGKLNNALPLLISVQTLGFFVVLKWGLRSFAWFWITLAAFAVAHACLIIFVPWSDQRIPAPALAGAASLDVVAMLVILDLVERLIGGRTSRNTR